MRRAPDKWERIGYDPGGAIGAPGCCWTWPLVALAVIVAWVVGRGG